MKFVQILRTKNLFLARQHPYYGGKVVYSARAILNLDIEDRLTSFRKKGIANKTFKNEYSFYPNPSTSIVKFQSTNNFKPNSILLIIDELNRVAKSISLNSENNEISFYVSDLANGIYIGKIKGDNDKIVKLVVTR
jgi:hypothetical protein